jgi:hypothetical protein
VVAGNSDLTGERLVTVLAIPQFLLDEDVDRKQLLFHTDLIEALREQGQKQSRISQKRDSLLIEILVKYCLS